MMKQDPRVDAYIEKAAPFAQPILRHLRAAVHAASPGAEETMKWSRPFFLHKGELLCMMAAFKAHAGFGFWKRGEGPVGGAPTGKDEDASGHFGRLTSLADLPPAAELDARFREAIALIDAGAKSAIALRSTKPPPEPPADLLAALAAEPKARANFDAFPPGQRREYVDWIVEAKRPETRARRVAQAAEWIAEGKRRNWKYEDC